MKYTRSQAVESLLKSFQAYYNLTLYNKENPAPEKLPLTAVGEYYETSQQYILHRKAEVWSANCEEFLFLFSCERLTADLYREMEAYAHEEGMKRAHIGKGHMYTYITPLVICHEADEDAKRLVKKCRTYKSFLFSIHGWMEMHTAVLECASDTITTNARGKCVGKTLKGVLFS